MQNDKKNLTAGIFVISGAAALLAMLFFLGLSDMFTDKISLRTGFTESVQGLNRGSAVKFRGVQIGTVSDIKILVKKNIIQVDMEIDPDLFAGHNFCEYPELFKNFMERQIRENGLRARLEMLGITGMKYIDFDYFAARGAKFQVPPQLTDDPYTIYVPSITSQMKDVSTTLTLAVDRISRINFENISAQLDSALTHLSSLLSSSDLQSAISRINDTAENLERSTKAISTVLDERKLNELTGELSKNLQKLTSLQDRIGAIAENSRLPESTAAFRRAADSLHDGRLELHNTLLKLNNTLESIKTMTDSISADPQSLLRGKKNSSPRK